VPAELRTILRAGRHRLHLISLVRAGLWWILPIAVVALLVAAAQRVGLVDVAWGPVAIALAVAWAVAAILTGGVRGVSDADVALALDEGLGLDDRLCTALAAEGCDNPMAVRAIDQAKQTVAGKVTPATLRAAMPWQWPRSAPWSGGVVLLAVLVAGTPASSARADQARAHAEVVLAEAAELAQPLAAQHEALAEALADMQMPLPELDTPEAVELEALRRLTTLQTALDELKATDAQQAAADAAEALWALPAAGSGAEDVQAIRAALQRGDFKQAGDALDALAESTRQTKPEGDRQDAMEALARDLEAAAERAAAMEQQRRDGESESSTSSAAEAIESMAQDVRECSTGTCDSPSEACDRMSESSGDAKDAQAASDACAAAAAECSGSRPGGSPGAIPGASPDASAGQNPVGGGGQMPFETDGAATTNVPMQPEAPPDATAEVIDVESVPGPPRDPDGVPIGPVPVGGAKGPVEHRGPSPESLRRLPARYQEAVRRFFGASDAPVAPAQPPADAEGSGEA